MTNRDAFTKLLEGHTQEYNLDFTRPPRPIFRPSSQQNKEENRDAFTKLLEGGK